MALAALLAGLDPEQRDVIAFLREENRAVDSNWCERPDDCGEFG
jgi:hypothetical protein